MDRTMPKKKPKTSSVGSDATNGADEAAERGIASAMLKPEFEDDENYRYQEDCEEDSTDFCMGNEMSSLLKNFQNDVKKNMTAKKKRLETLTAQSATNCKSKVDAILETQRKERQVLHNEYTKQMNNLFGQWESDISKVKENEDKLNAVLQEQIKLIAQIRMVQTQRSMDEVEMAHGQQKARGTSDLKDTDISNPAKSIKSEHIGRSDKKENDQQAIVTPASQLESYENHLKAALTMENPDVPKALNILEQIDQYPVTATLLQKCSSLVSTVKKIRRYKASPKIMEKAEKVYNNFKVVFCKVDNDVALLSQAKKTSGNEGTAKEISDSKVASSVEE